ncbi:hypothetical protein [Bogoriella caseilytica]|uniref:hypothetical protein n=1 Tax=Bogoriella caseilytica TaxID=56055 RepID=UPI000F49B1A5|nr:hypothetical protein [Bogoriella caseilytica]
MSTPEETSAAEQAAGVSSTGSAPSEVPLHEAVDRRTVRRAPRYSTFIFLGVVLAAVAAFILSGFPPSQVAIDQGVHLARGTLFLILLATLGVVGGVLGAIVAVALDRLSLRRLRRRMREVRPPGE